MNRTPHVLHSAYTRYFDKIQTLKLSNNNSSSSSTSGSSSEEANSPEVEHPLERRPDIHTDLQLLNGVIKYADTDDTDDMDANIDDIVSRILFCIF